MTFLLIVQANELQAIRADIGRITPVCLLDIRACDQQQAFSLELATYAPERSAGGDGAESPLRPPA